MDFEPREPIGFDMQNLKIFLIWSKSSRTLLIRTQSLRNSYGKKHEEGHLKQGAPAFLWQWTHSGYCVPFAGRTRTNRSKWYTTPPKLVYNIQSTYIIQKRGRGPRNTNSTQHNIQTKTNFLELFYTGMFVSNRRNGYVQ